MKYSEDPYVEAPLNFVTQDVLDDMVEVRRDLYVDPLLAHPWSCDPARCRPLLGANLCCKVERRCSHFKADRCDIHALKPLGCALFPLDLLRVGSLRVVTTVKNATFFESGWSRYDRDMLRCFEGCENGTSSMFEVQRSVLECFFTRSELKRMEGALFRMG